MAAAAAALLANVNPDAINPIRIVSGFLVLLLVIVMIILVFKHNYLAALIIGALIGTIFYFTRSGQK